MNSQDAVETMRELESMMRILARAEIIIAIVNGQRVGIDPKMFAKFIQCLDEAVKITERVK